MVCADAVWLPAANGVHLGLLTANSAGLDAGASIP